jgi:hypothetical protein
MIPFQKWKRGKDVGKSILVLRASRYKADKFTIPMRDVKVNPLFPTPLIAVIDEINGMVRQVLGWIPYQLFETKILNYAKKKNWRKLFWNYNKDTKLLWYCTNKVDDTMEEVANVITPMDTDAKFEFDDKKKIPLQNYFDASGIKNVNRSHLMDCISNRIKLLKLFPCSSIYPRFPDSIAYRRSNKARLFGSESIRCALEEEGCVDWEDGPTADLYNVKDPLLDRASFHMLFRYMLLKPNRVLYRSWWIERELLLFKSRLPNNMVPVAQDIFGIEVEQLDHDPTDGYLESKHPLLGCSFASYSFVIRSLQRPDYVMVDGLIVFTKHTLTKICSKLFRDKIMMRINEADLARNAQTDIICSMGRGIKPLLKYPHIRSFKPPRLKNPKQTLFRLKVNNIKPVTPGLAELLGSTCMMDTKKTAKPLRPKSNQCGIYVATDKYYKKPDPCKIAVPADKDGYVKAVFEMLCPYLHPWYIRNMKWEPVVKKSEEKRGPNEFKLYGIVKSTCREKRPCLLAVGKLARIKNNPKTQMHISNQTIFNVKQTSAGVEVYYKCYSNKCPNHYIRLAPY